MTSRTYEAPGPGTWEQDSTHCPRPLTPYLFDLFKKSFVQGFKEGSARYGLLFSHLEPALVNGFMYYRDSVVDPDDSEEVGRRFESARHGLESKIWREDLDLWDREIKPDSIRRNNSLQSVGLAGLDADGLLAHLAAVYDNAHEMVYRHHKFSITALIPMGLYLANAMDWHGCRSVVGAAPGLLACLAWGSG